MWLVESAVDGLASPSDRLSRDFVQQVIGAACSEESLKFIGVGLLIWLAYRRGEHEVRALVAIAISVGIGFMTLENLVAVIASDTPMSKTVEEAVHTPAYQLQLHRDVLGARRGVCDACDHHCDGPSAMPTTVEEVAHTPACHLQLHRDPLDAKRDTRGPCDHQSLRGS